MGQITGQPIFTSDKKSKKKKTDSGQIFFRSSQKILTHIAMSTKELKILSEFCIILLKIEWKLVRTHLFSPSSKKSLHFV